MTAELEAALEGVFIGAPRGSFDEARVRALVEELVSLGCGNLVDKLVKEGKKKRASGGLTDFEAELRLARAIARYLGTPVTFGVGDAADLRFSAGGVDCLVEVKHDRAPAPWAAVFYPDPVDIPAMASAPERWQQAGYRLHRVLEALAVAVEPWLGEAFLKERYGGQERRAHDELCGDLASWLAEKLPDAVRSGMKELGHPTLKAKFALTPLHEPPGHMLGHGSLEAWFVDRGTMRASVKTKAEKAIERLAATGADCYLVGIVVAQAVALDGTELLTELLGPCVHRGGPGGGPGGGSSFRSVLAQHRAEFERARAAGRGSMLEAARFDVDEQGAYGDPGLFFDADLAAVAGALGLYYTEDLQFVPNAFSTRRIEDVCRLFPASLVPFAVR